MPARRERRRVGPGRPPKDAHERLRNRLMVSFTDRELEALEREAGEERPSALVRRVVLRYLARRRR